MPETERPTVDAAVVVPVNAYGDQEPALRLLADLSRYRGPHRLETIVVLNNFAADEAPAGTEALTAAGARVLSVPDVHEPGLSVYIAARAAGARAASSDAIVLFDADCRLTNPTALLDWYVEALRGGAHAAYTSVRHHELSPHPTVRVRVWLHHIARWTKRVVLRVPTMRGSNYAVLRRPFLELVDARRIVHDIDVGLAFKRARLAVRYGDSPELVVLTSGRHLRAGWWRILRWVPRRVWYHARHLAGS